MLEKYNHIFLSCVEVKNGMIIGVHEYELSNPLQEEVLVLVEQAIIQYTIREEVKNIYTDIPLKNLTDLTELAKTEKISMRQPSR